MVKEFTEEDDALLAEFGVEFETRKAGKGLVLCNTTLMLLRKLLI